MSHRQDVDRSSESALALCSCGWRQLTKTAPTAWAAARAHALHAHRGEDCNAINSRYEGKYR